MKIIQAIYTVNGEKMTVREVAEHAKHFEVKHALKCSTEGCQAKISFVSGAPGISDHFRRVRYSQHSPECYIKRKEEELKEKVRNKEVVEVSLDEKGTIQRVMYLFQKINKPKNPNSGENNPGKRKVITAKTKTVTGITGILGDPEAPSMAEIKNSNKNVSLRLSSRELNQISEADEGAYIQLSSPIEQIIQVDNGFVLNLRHGNAKAKLVINEAFLKGSKDVQIEEYLKNLSEFIYKQKDRYSISVYAFCMFDVFKENETIITASSFDKFFISVSGQRHKPRKLDSFQALFVTGVWSN